MTKILVWSLFWTRYFWSNASDILLMIIESQILGKTSDNAKQGLQGLLPSANQASSHKTQNVFECVQKAQIPSSWTLKSFSH